MVKITVDDFGDIIVLNIDGVFSIDSTEYADVIWKEQIEKKPKTIGFNCRDIASIDSSALGYLVSRMNEAMKMGIDIIFYDLSDENQKGF
jgi:anti-anti-sigma factor